MPPRPKLLIVLLLALLAGGAEGSSLRGDRFEARALSPAMQGPAVCYGPHRDGQRPGGTEPSAEEIREDLHLMLPHWNLLRVYGASGFAETMLKVIRADELAMKVMLGTWISPEDDEANESEIQAAVRLAADYPEIVTAICVGNETQVSWSAHRCPLEYLLGYVGELRRQVTVPVTVADDFNFWNKPESRALTGRIDFITLHAHPLWNGLQLEDALPWLRERLEEARSLHPERPVLLGETGWATSVHDEGEQARLIKGRPGEEEQKRFHESLRAWAEAESLIVFTFEAFDENWKGGTHPAEVEKHWGLFRADRSPKAAMESAGVSR